MKRIALLTILTLIMFIAVITYQINNKISLKLMPYVPFTFICEAIYTIILIILGICYFVEKHK